MQHIIDVDNEKAKLWNQVYTDLKYRLSIVSSEENPYTSTMLPSYITSVYLESDELIIVTTPTGEKKLIEEYSDEEMYLIYQCLIQES